MQNFGDTLRAMLAGLLGLAASVLALYVLFWVTHDAPPDAHDLGPNAVVGVVAGTGAAMVLAWIYAAWFDALLAGSALMRGAKFGIIAWIWLGAVAVFMYQVAGLAMPVHGRALAEALAYSVAPLLVHGCVVGLVYGSGRVYDEYRAGIGYGVTDRNSLG